MLDSLTRGLDKNELKDVRGLSWCVLTYVLEGSNNRLGSIDRQRCRGRGLKRDRC